MAGGKVRGADGVAREQYRHAFVSGPALFRCGLLFSGGNSLYIIKRRAQRLDDRLRAQIRAADTHHDQYVRVLAYPRGAFFHALQFFAVVRERQIHPAGEIRSRSGLSVQLRVGRVDRRLQSGQLMFFDKIRRSRGVKTDVFHNRYFPLSMI